MASVAVVFCVLIALAWGALQPSRAPAPLGTDAPGAVFSAARALPDFQTLARAPRPIASDANARARQHILDRLHSMQLEPEVQSASAQKTTMTIVAFYHWAHVALGTANNVLVRVPGSAPGHAQRSALLVASHYDSAPDKLGAADASASVAAMLETLRALRNGPPLANDVIFLFADGEKAGSLGVRAFAEKHRWARDVGVVLQFDAAGNSGPMMLTGSRGSDGKLVQGWADAVPMALGSSGFQEIARQTPGLLKAGPLDRLGMAGMRFANIEGSTGHNGGLDLPGRVDHGTLQHAGDTMLALTRHFGNVPLETIGGTARVHFDVPLIGQVHYPTSWVWPITRLVCLIFFLVCCVAVMRSGMEMRPLAIGALIYLLLAGGLALAAITLWKGFPGFHENYNPLASGAGARDRWYLLAYITLGVAVFIEVQRGLHKALGLPATTLGAMLVLLLLLIGGSIFMPGVTYLLAWPMIAALLAYAATYIPRVAAAPQRIRLAILLAGAAPAVMLFAPLVQQQATLFTPQRSALLMLTLAVLLGLGTALLAAARRRFVAPLLLVTCAGSLMTAENTRQYDTQMAKPNRMTYLKDAYSWKSWWLMPAEPLDEWSRQFFNEARGTRELREVFGMGPEERWIARAPVNEVQFPDLVALKDDEEGGRRKIAFTMRSKNKSPTIEVRVQGATIIAARLDGKLLTDRPVMSWTMNIHGAGERQHRMEFDVSPGSIVRIFVQERIPGLPNGFGGPRPNHTPLTGTTIASDMLVFH